MTKSKKFLIISTFIFLFFSCSKEKSTGGDLYSGKEHIKSNSYTIEVVANNLWVPWSIVFTGSNRILITERNGNLRVIENGKLSDNPLYTFGEVASRGEGGLMGMTLDPDYENNKYIYFSYTYGNNDDVYVKIVRFKDAGNTITEEKTLLDNIRGASFHDGCRLRFGPDKKLYITTGDAGDKEDAQDINKLNGKILRLNSDGSIPEDNPFPDNPVWCYGNRNPQGIAWYPGTDIMYETEHGPSGFDGPGGGDEVNIIKKGNNYGWPVVHHKMHKEGMEDPLLEFTPAVAPAGAMFYKGNMFPEFNNNFFFCCLRGEGIIRVIIDENDPEKIISYNKMKEIDFGRIRDIEEAPDGSIYFCTSNRDGRGTVREGDDKIYRIVNK
ncbi:PQQ-dependent sugar dehydrogenase [bacterium BMS3Abin03]|nr:PQQ-dependent sugar dehydrogenase [bacterium BMS3Abin03]